MRWIDAAIILLYLAGMVALGLWFARRQNSTEAYFVAKRSIPSWAMGISLYAALITSITFVAYPGNAYAGNWAELIPGFMVVVVLAIVGFLIIPFYRQVVGMSAYEYFGKRFGKSVRTYSSFAFAMGHFSKMGFVYYLLALAISGMTGWDKYGVIVGVGIVTVLYTYLGGLEAVIWADVIQGVIKLIGVIICLGYLLYLPPGGPSATLKYAWDHGKISLGSLSWGLSNKSFLVLALYGFFWYLQKYTADQTLVQRYLVARTDREALKGVALGALLCIPVWAMFLLIGSLLWSFYHLTGEPFPARVAKPDQVFPYFLSTHMPVGMAGIFMASLLAAAMSMLSSDLNCLAVVGVEDYYRMLKPNSTDRQRLRAGKVIVACCGVLAVLIAMLLAKTSGAALGLYFIISSIVSGGLFGLFALGFFCSRAGARAAWCGIVASLLFTSYGVLTREQKALDLGPLNFPWHPIMIGVLAHVVLFVFGYACSFLFRRSIQSGPELTVWSWLRERKCGDKSLATVAESELTSSSQ